MTGMMTGTPADFLQRPEDINPPQPNYFFNVFWMVHSYMNLVLALPTPVPGKGIIKLFSYRMGVLTPDTSMVEKCYLDLLSQNNSKLRNDLTQFGNGMISYNLITLITLLSKTLIKDMSRGFGDHTCLNAAVLEQISYYCRFYKTPKSRRDQREDNIKNLVLTCSYSTKDISPGVSSLVEITELIDVFNRVIVDNLQAEADELSRRKYLLDITRILFYIGCRYYHLNELRFTDQKMRRAHTRPIKINDFTLAALPFDPTMLYSCTDDGGMMSQFGIEYVQSLTAVLSELGGIEIVMNLPQ